MSYLQSMQGDAWENAMRKPSHPNLLKEMVKVQDLEGKYISGADGWCGALGGY
jgi:hypothetical protein